MMNPEVPDPKFPPASWSDRQVIDYLVLIVGNHLKSHDRFAYILLTGLFILTAAFIGVLLT